MPQVRCYDDAPRRMSVDNNDELTTSVRRQQTFSTHPWSFMTECTIASSSTGGPTAGVKPLRLVVSGKPVFFPEWPGSAAGSAAEDRVVVARIELPSLVAWSTRSHHKFQPGFKAAVQALLCSHARLSSSATAGGRCAVEHEGAQSLLMNDDPHGRENSPSAVDEEARRTSCAHDKLISAAALSARLGAVRA